MREKENVLSTLGRLPAAVPETKCVSYSRTEEGEMGQASLRMKVLKGDFYSFGRGKAAAGDEFILRRMKEGREGSGRF